MITDFTSALTEALFTQAFLNTHHNITKHVTPMLVIIPSVLEGFVRLVTSPLTTSALCLWATRQGLKDSFAIFTLKEGKLVLLNLG